MHEAIIGSCNNNFPVLEEVGVTVTVQKGSPLHQKATNGGVEKGTRTALGDLCTRTCSLGNESRK